MMDNKTEEFEARKAIAYLTLKEQDFLIKLIRNMKNDSKTMISLKNGINRKESLFMLFIIVGKRKLFNTNESSVSSNYNKYALSIRKLGFNTMPFYQDLRQHFLQLKDNHAQFNKNIELVDNQLKAFLKMYGKPNIDFIPEQELNSLKNKEKISATAKEILSIADDVLGNSGDVKYVKDLILLFNKDISTLKTFGRKIVKGEDVLNLFKKAIKRKPNKEVKSLFDDFISHMENEAEEAKDADIDPIAIQSYPKNILINELNWKMLEIINEVISNYPFKIRSFRDYNKELFNECFDELRKRYKHEILGKCLMLRDMIKILNVKVNNQGYEMLLNVINKFKDKNNVI